MAGYPLNFNTYLRSLPQLDLLERTALREVIVEPEPLARWGALTLEATQALIKAARERGFRVMIQWDVLSTDMELRRQIEFFERLPHDQIEAVRVQEPGAAQFLHEVHPGQPFHLIVETHSHNWRALERWCSHFGPQLQRLVLSSELPGNAIKDYSARLPTACEVLGLGRLLLFYTPRSLLRPLEKANTAPTLERWAASDEHLLHHLPMLENRHGTFVFHYYDLCWLDLLPELQQTHLHTMRLDLRFAPEFQWIERILKNPGASDEMDWLRSVWPVRLTHGFYRVNRTDRPLERLQNPYWRERSADLVAYVVEARKESHLALATRRPFAQGETLVFVTPEGYEVEGQPTWIRNTQGQSVEWAEAPGLWLVPHLKRIVPKSLVYRRSPDSEATKSAL